MKRGGREIKGNERLGGKIVIMRQRERGEGKEEKERNEEND